MTAPAPAPHQQVRTMLNGAASAEPTAPKEETTLTDLEFIEKTMGLPLPVTMVVRSFVHDDAPISMVLGDEITIRWPHTKDLFDPKALFRPFAMRSIKRPDGMKKADVCWDVATAICNVANAFIAHDDLEDPRTDARSRLGSHPAAGVAGWRQALPVGRTRATGDVPLPRPGGMGRRCVSYKPVAT
jgi:hypothetical protein